MDLNLARRLAGKLTFGEPFTLAETLLLKTTPDIREAFERLLKFPVPTLNLEERFAQTYYVEPLPSTHDITHFRKSFELFTSLQYASMVELLIQNALPLNLGFNWDDLIYTVVAYAPASILALLFQQVRQFSKMVYKQNFYTILRLVGKKDLARFEELVKLTPYSWANWSQLGRLEITNGNVETARVLLSKAGLDANANAILRTAAISKSIFDPDYTGRVRAMLEELGYRLDYRELMPDAIDGVLAGKLFYEEVLKFYLAHDPQLQTNMDFYLAYIEGHIWGSPSKKQQLRELIEASI